MILESDQGTVQPTPKSSGPDQWTEDMREAPSASEGPDQVEHDEREDEDMPTVEVVRPISSFLFWPSTAIIFLRIVLSVLGIQT